MLAELSSEDKDYLHQLCSVSQIDANFSIPNEKKNNEQKLLDRFELLRGQIVAGNDSKELISEFKRILIKLKETNKLPKGEVAEIMSFLLEMGSFVFMYLICSLYLMTFLSFSHQKELLLCALNLVYSNIDLWNNIFDFDVLREREKRREKRVN